MNYSCKNICQYLLLGLLSHVGTLIIIILYLVGGGFLFILLEVENERSACFTSLDLLSQKLNDTTLRGMAISSSGYNATVYYQQLYMMLFNFSKDVYRLGVSPSKDCSTLGTENNLPSWNLANSIFFCATIITTIGYGNLYPTTMWGRIVCIIYGFIGIPLMLLFLGNFGEILADAFRYVYMNLCCCVCFIKHKKIKEVEVENTFNTSAIQLTNFEMEKCENESQMNLKSIAPQKINPDAEVQIIEVEEENNEEINIPLTVVISFLIAYMFLGAVIFRIWEEWDLTAAIYFSFITVSTIGFGDLYPAKDTIGSSSATIELLLGAVYCVVGLAVLSMCLTLVKEEIVGKFTWFGEKLGIIKNNNNTEEDYNDYSDETNVIHLSNEKNVSIYENEAFQSSMFPQDNEFSSKLKFT